MARGDHYRARAEAAEKSAAEAKSPDIKRQFRELATQWRDLGRQADEHEAVIKDRDSL